MKVPSVQGRQRHYLRIPLGESSLKVIEKDFFPVTRSQHKVPKTLRCEYAHQMHKDRCAGYRHHHLRKILGKRIGPRPLAATKNYYLHIPPRKPT
jgi:hypothetical protein